MLSQKPTTTIVELVNTTGKDENTIFRRLERLKKNGLVERIGSRKTGHWKVLTQTL